MRYYISILFATCFLFGKSQTVINTDTIHNDPKSENIFMKPLFGDSLASSFCIIIPKEVKPHKHPYHSEHLQILEGEGLMKLGDKTFAVKKGDLIFIPKNMVHSVKSTGAVPMKVLSIQAPYFNGDDRVMVEEK